MLAMKCRFHSLTLVACDDNNFLLEIAENIVLKTTSPTNLIEFSIWKDGKRVPYRKCRGASLVTLKKVPTTTISLSGQRARQGSSRVMHSNGTKGFQKVSVHELHQTYIDVPWVAVHVTIFWILSCRFVWSTIEELLVKQQIEICHGQNARPSIRSVHVHLRGLYASRLVA